MGVWAAFFAALMLVVPEWAESPYDRQAFMETAKVAPLLPANDSLTRVVRRTGKKPRDAEVLKKAIVKFSLVYNKNLKKQESKRIAEALLEESERLSVDPLLVASLIALESSFIPTAVSSAGAVGLGQLKVGTAAELGVTDRLNPVQNVYGTVRYLAKHLARWKDSPEQVERALASYRLGPTLIIKRNGIPDVGDLKRYLQIVSVNYARILKLAQ